MPINMEATGEEGRKGGGGAELRGHGKGDLEGQQLTCRVSCQPCWHLGHLGALECYHISQGQFELSTVVLPWAIFVLISASIVFLLLPHLLPPLIFSVSAFTS